MKLEFPDSLRKRMRKNLARAGRREIGGILMAEQLDPGHFRLVDFSVDAATGGTAHFIRSVDHHERFLKSFFEQTGSDFGRFNYLGEWHSHPNHTPVPSSTDIASMRELVRGERDIPFAILLIVRKVWWSRMLCSVTLFQKHCSPENVTLIVGD